MKALSVKSYLIDTFTRDQIEDVATHGCAGGTVSTLLYCNDSTVFYLAYKDDIWEIINDYAQACGMGTLELLATNNKGIIPPEMFEQNIVWMAVELVAQQIIDEYQAEEETEEEDE